MARTGGRPGRTYVSGETRRAISSRLGRLASHCTAYVLRLGPSSRSTTSAIPYQSIMAATFGKGAPGHCRSKTALSGIIPVLGASGPPPNPPLSPSRFVSTSYVLACAATYDVDTNRLVLSGESAGG